MVLSFFLFFLFLLIFSFEGHVPMFSIPIAQLNVYAHLPMCHLLTHSIHIFNLPYLLP